VAHPASYSTGTSTNITGGKAPERENHHSSTSSAEVKNDGAVPPLPVMRFLVKSTIICMYIYIYQGAVLIRAEQIMIGGCRVTGASLQEIKKRKFCALPGLELRPLGRYSRYSRYTDCATATLRCICLVLEIRFNWRRVSIINLFSLVF
jgi:hypothetical protein